MTFTMDNQNSVFVETKAAGLVFNILKYAQCLGYMVSIQGPPGIGKTRAIEEYRDRSSSPVWLFTASRATAAVGPLIRALAQTFAGTKDMRTFENFRSVVWAIQNAGCEYLPLLVIDEAQNLRPDAIEELRSIHDATQCGIAFSGNHSFLDRHGREQVNLLSTPQFKSRLARDLPLPIVDPDEAEAVARALGVPNAALTKRLALHAKGTAGLRIISRVAELAEAIKSGPVATVTDYEDAFKILGS